MTKIQNFLDNNTPFSVMQYFESFKGSKEETRKKYEIIYVNPKKELAFRVLTQQEVSFVKQNTDRIKLIMDNKDGSVYEFNNFKAYQEKVIREHQDQVKEQRAKIKECMENIEQLTAKLEAFSADDTINTEILKSA